MDTCAGNHGTDKYDILYAREFNYDGARQRYLYDGARQRYLTRALIPSRLEDGVIEALAGQEIWSDYDGDGVYGDFTVSGGNIPTPRLVVIDDGEGGFRCAPFARVPNKAPEWGRNLCGPIVFRCYINSSQRFCVFPSARSVHGRYSACRRRA